MFLSMLAFLLSFVTAFSATALMRKYALKSALLDQPGERSLHQLPTPRGGGVGIVIGFVLGLLVYHVLSRAVPLSVFGLTGLALGMSVLGFFDDRFSLSAKARLFAQFGLSLVLIVLLKVTYSDSEWLEAFGGLPFLFISTLVVLFCVWMTNLYNFMDGSDGIAALQLATASLGLALLLVIAGDPAFTGVAFLLAASSLGFLFWNWQPAKIFMGDAGSLFIGFFSAGLILCLALSGVLSLVVVLILHGTFVVDATVTLFTRLLRGRKPHQAHRSHAYQRLIRQGRSHRFIAIAYGLVNLFWLLPIAYWASLQKSFFTQILILLMAWLPLAIFAICKKAGFDN